MKRQLSQIALAASLLLVGCASAPTANPKDPWEPMNRSVASFNDKVDDNVLKPLATGYRNVVPDLIQTGVRNVFNNFADMWSTINSALQLKPLNTVELIGRVVVNTVFGIYGIFDVASYIKLERHPEDFGQTLGYWGVPNGPYLVLPLFGPSTLRDGASLPIDFAVSPTQFVNDIPTRNQVFTLRLVSKRAELLKSGNMLEQASIDKYSFTRDAYLQYRRSQIYDGNPPDEEDSNDDPSANPVPVK
ncbi:MAG: VacJ family lipoprotein [Betaproteobacteria bacterium]